MLVDLRSGASDHDRAAFGSALQLSWMPAYADMTLKDLQISKEDRSKILSENAARLNVQGRKT